MTAKTHGSAKIIPDNVLTCSDGFRPVSAQSGGACYPGQHIGLGSSYAHDSGPSWEWDLVTYTT